QADDLSPTSIKIRHLDRLGSNLQDSVPAFHDLAFVSPVRAASVAQDGDLLRVVRLFSHANELQRNRRQSGRRRRADWSRRGRFDRTGGGRRRLRLELEEIPCARAGPWPLLAQVAQPYVRCLCCRCGGGSGAATRNDGGGPCGRWGVARPEFVRKGRDGKRAKRRR